MEWSLNINFLCCIIFLKEYPGDELLLVYDKDFKFGLNFYLIGTEEGKENYLNVSVPQTLAICCLSEGSCIPEAALYMVMTILIHFCFPGAQIKSWCLEQQCFKCRMNQVKHLRVADIPFIYLSLTNKRGNLEQQAVGHSLTKTPVLLLSSLWVSYWNSHM